MDVQRMSALQQPEPEIIAPRIFMVEMHTQPSKPLPCFEDNFQYAKRMVQMCRNNNADMVILPEAFVTCGKTLSDALRDDMHHLLEFHQMCIDTFAPLARRSDDLGHPGMYICFGTIMRDQATEKLHNAAVLLDRGGDVAGIYFKRHITEEELEADIEPGAAAVVAHTELGNIGFSLSFDLNFSDHYKEMKRQGAQFVLHLAKRPSGLRLQSQALQNEMWILSCTQTGGCSFMDVSGTVLHKSNLHQPLLPCTVNLSRVLFHIRSRKKETLAKLYLNNVVQIQTLEDDDSLFWVEAKDGRMLTLQRVVDSVKIRPYLDYVRLNNNLNNFQHPTG